MEGSTELSDLNSSIEITPGGYAEIRKYEGSAFKGNSSEIIGYMRTLGNVIEDNSILDGYANYVPAWVIEHPDEGEKIILNTGLVESSRIQEVFMRHESVEILMARRDLDLREVAARIGIDPQIVLDDNFNTPAHYVAIYYQTKLARELGVVDEMVSEMKRSVSTFLKEVVLPKSKVEAQAYNEPWQQCFKYKTQELVRLNISSLKQIVKFATSK